MNCFLFYKTEEQRGREKRKENREKIAAPGWKRNVRPLA